MTKRFVQNLFSVVALVVLLAGASGCSQTHEGLILGDEQQDNDTQITDDGSTNPSVSETPAPCTTDLTDNCVDQATPPSDNLDLASQNIDFGIGEIEVMECQTISIPAGATYEAEFDSEQTSSTSDGSLAFALKTTTGDLTAERINGSDSFSICYLRTEIGTHSGRVNVVLNGSGSAAYVLTLAGQTMQTVFTIETPTTGQIFDARDGHNAGVDNIEGDYLMTVSGSVNLDLVGIFAQGISTPVIVEVAGIQYKADLSDSGKFTTTVGLPQTPGVYTVTLSLDSTKDDPITKSIDVVVAGAPEITLEVRDNSGNAIDSGIPSDVADLIAGIKVKNLNVSGSSQTEMPVNLESLTWNGEEILDGTVQVWTTDGSWCADGDLPADNNSTFLGFEGSSTYCVRLDNVTNVQTGTNTIVAKAGNDLGDASATFSLILDYSKPALTIESPEENQLYPTGTTAITISGSIKNYAPVAAEEAANIPSPHSDGDVGSYCWTSDDSSDDTCPNSGVSLWFNASNYRHAIHIYPQIIDQYANLTQQELFDLLPDDQCRTSEATTTLLAAKSGTTTVADGVITTVITSTSSSGTTATSSYVTSNDGTITATASDGTITTPAGPGKDSSDTNTVTKADDGSITLTIVDTAAVSTTVITTDATTGEITQTITQKSCNLPEGNFSITFEAPSDLHHGVINLYSNAIEMQAQSIVSHKTTVVRTFATGTTNPHDFQKTSANSNTGNLTLGALGSVDSKGAIIRAPITLNLSEGILTRQDAKLVIQKALNDNLKLEDFINGWMSWPKDDNDNIDIEADFQRQYPYTDFYKLPTEWQEKFINQALHSDNMALKLWALTRYVGKGIRDGSFDPDYATNYMFQRGVAGENKQYTQYNIARDACDEPITEAFVPVGDLKVIAEHLTNSNDDPLNPEDVQFLPEWPWVAGSDTDFNDFTSGKWIVQNANFDASRGEGAVDLDICLVPADADIENCDDDIPASSVLPAIWGHFTSYALVEGGVLGEANPLPIDDDTLPMLWSVGKLRLKLTDAITLKKTNIDGVITNKLTIDSSKIKIATGIGEVHDLQKTADENTVQLFPFTKCADYYRSLVSNGQYHDPGNLLVPFGCSDNINQAYPFLIEINSSKGQDFYNIDLAKGQNGYFDDVIWWGVMDDFRKIVGCLDEEKVNHILSPSVFPAQPWAMDQSSLSFDFALDNTDDGLSLTSQEDAVNPLFLMSLNVPQADLLINRPTDVSSFSALTARLPMTITATGVSDPSSATSSKIATANTSGHLIRSLSPDFSDLPPHSSDPSSEMFAGLSLNIEEIINAASYLIYKKGPLSLLDVLDVDEIQKNDDYSFGVDKVVFSRFDICGDLAGALKTDLPPDIFFPLATNLFGQASMHIDITLDKNYPPTLAIEPLEIKDSQGNALPDAVTIKLGLNNIALGFKELIPDTTTDEDDYTIGTEDILKLRVDGTLTVNAVYHQEIGQLSIFIPAYDNQNLHLSVLSGSASGIYSDTDITGDLNGLVKTVFSKFAKDVIADTDPEKATAALTLPMSDGKLSVVQLSDASTTFNATGMTNGTCDGETKPTYVGETSTGTSDKVRSSLSGKFKPALFNDGRMFTKIEKGQALFDICDMASIGPIGGANNSIQKNLCDFGIEDVTLDADIGFDTDRGLITLTADFALKLYDWMTGN